jgi:hypothetical protein
MSPRHNSYQHESGLSIPFHDEPYQINEQEDENPEQYSKILIHHSSTQNRHKQSNPKSQPKQKK